VVELADVVEAFVAGGLPIGECRALPVSGSAEVGFDVPIHEQPALSTWKLARPICAGLGLWPVIMPCSCGPYGVKRLGAREAWEDDDEQPASIVARAEEMPWPVSADRASGWTIPAHHWMAELHDAQRMAHRRYGEAPSDQELIQACAVGDHLALEYALLCWEQERRDVETGQRSGPFFHPDEVKTPHLALLPTSSPWAVPAFAPYWGAGLTGSFTQTALIRTLREWYDRHGVVPCSVEGTVLHLFVDRPITDLSEAFEAAVAQASFARLEGSVRDRARGLIDADLWELYDRP